MIPLGLGSAHVFIVQWVTKVMTLATIRNTVHGSRGHDFCGPLYLYNFFRGAIADCVSTPQCFSTFP